MIALASPPAAPVKEAARTEKQKLNALLTTISASRLSTFLQCRLRFFFQYVAELVRPKSPSLHVGSTVHEVLRSWNKARWRGQQLTPAELEEAFEHAWANPEEPAKWDSEADEKEKKQMASALLATYFVNAPINPEIKPEAVEAYIEADLSKHGLPRLTGVLDLVQEKKIVDFKTASSTPNPQTAAHQHEIQSTAYSILYRESVGEPEQAVEFHTLVKLKTPKLVVTPMPPMTESRKTRLFKSIESYVQGVTTKDFVPSPGLACCQCAFLAECRKWS